MAVSRPSGLEHWIQALVFDQQSVGLTVVTPARVFTPARLHIDDTQAYIRPAVWTVNKEGYPVSALGVGGIGSWKKNIFVARTLRWPSGLVCLVDCINTN